MQIRSCSQANRVDGARSYESKLSKENEKSLHRNEEENEYFLYAARQQTARIGDKLEKDASSYMNLSNKENKPDEKIGNSNFGESLDSGNFSSERSNDSNFGSDQSENAIFSAADNEHSTWLLRGLIKAGFEDQDHGNFEMEIENTVDGAMVVFNKSENGEKVTFSGFELSHDAPKKNAKGSFERKSIEVDLNTPEQQTDSEKSNLPTLSEKKLLTHEISMNERKKSSKVLSLEGLGRLGEIAASEYLLIEKKEKELNFVEDQGRFVLQILAWEKAVMFQKSETTSLEKNVPDSKEIKSLIENQTEAEA